MSDVTTFINPPELATHPGYSQIAIARGGRLVVIAGQVALDREGNLVGAGNLAAQAEQVFRNLATALAAAGCTPRHLLKLTVFLRDMDRLADYRIERERFFAGITPPAVTLVEVARLYRDDALIEIEALAMAD